MPIRQGIPLGRDKEDRGAQMSVRSGEKVGPRMPME